jgi:DNA-cytosine methyltransferase
LKVLGLFSGIGGFELGLQQAGMKIETMCEIEEYCRNVLHRNFKDVKIIEDVKNLTAKPDTYDVLCGGFPCTQISHAGKGGGIEGKDSSLWKEYKRLIDEAKPKYAVIENVSAILSRGIDVILQDLAEIGYDAAWTMFDSKYFGVPQRRRRVYIIGVRDGIPSETDIFQFSKRSDPNLKYEMDFIDKSFEWDFSESTEVEVPFTFFTRQRSDQFACLGVSSTLMKRDYKDFTDLVLMNGKLRRVTPTERLKLQGFPKDWFNDTGLTVTQQYTCNGMTVPVTKHIGELILEFDNAL